MQRRFDPTATWYAMAEHGVNTIMITGDAMGRPIIEAYEADRRRPRPVVAGSAWRAAPPSSRPRSRTASSTTSRT